MIDLYSVDPIIHRVFRGIFDSTLQYVPQSFSFAEDRALSAQHLVSKATHREVGGLTIQTLRNTCDNVVSLCRISNQSCLTTLLFGKPEVCKGWHPNNVNHKIHILD